MAIELTPKRSGIGHIEKFNNSYKMCMLPCQQDNVFLLKSVNK